jgi:hypothetical protein
MVDLPPWLYGDEFLVGSASGAEVITPGDWAMASSHFTIPGLSGTIAEGAHRYSGLGVFVNANPMYDPLGNAYTNPGPLICTRGVIRVSAGDSAAGATSQLLGSPVQPITTASGIVVPPISAGATGVGQIWATAAIATWATAAGGTASLAAMPYGVGIIISGVKAGDVTAGQIDVRFNLATNIW